MDEMNRTEHLEWCKERALQYLNSGDINNAVTSMLSDLRKHPQTETHCGIQMGTMMMMAGLLKTENDVRKFIEGFN